MAEADSLKAELDGLHPVLEQELGAGGSISPTGFANWPTRNAVRLFRTSNSCHTGVGRRTLDLRAHRAADIARYVHNNRIWFEREEQEIAGADGGAYLRTTRR